MTPLALLAAAPPGAIDLLTDLALIMCVAAVTTLLFQRLHQPVVLGYILAGLMVGPHLPIPLFADEAVAHQLSELGVILLMFSLGVEFSLRKLVRVAPTAGVVAIIQCSLMVWLGYLVGRAFGWSGYESLFVGAAIAISSTTIIVRAFAEARVDKALSDMVFGVLVVEDLVGILLLAILPVVASGARLDAGALALTVGKLAGFLAVILVAGMLFVPRLIRAVVRQRRPETTVVAAVGLAFAAALFARRAGYSVALGAFLGGALVAESGASKIIEHRIEGVRDMFAAVFFVSVGMLIDPRLVWANRWAVLVLTILVIAGKLVSVTVGAFVAGNGVRTSVQAGLSMAQIGEFSFIIAGLGVAQGATRSFLYPVAVAVSALTTLTTPFLIRSSGRVASFVDGRLPHSLQTYAALYGAWVGGLRGTREHRTAWTRIRRLAGLLVVDVTLLALIVVAASRLAPAVSRFIARVTGLGAAFPRAALVVATLALLSPFLFGAVRLARALGAALASEALPAPNGGKLDLAAAPRRALLVTLQIAIVMVAGVPVVAVTQPFLPSGEAMAILLLAVAGLVVALWRSAANLQGHVRAGAQVILEHLAAQSAPATPGSAGAPVDADVTANLLPGLGNARAVRVGAGSRVAGSTLRELDLRGLTGATVIAIHREPADVIYPSADERLHAGDTLVVSGTAAAVESARALFEEAAASK